MSLNLKSWTYWGYAIGLLVALQPSYIHPDEHFQTLEIMTQVFGNVKGTIPWEFQTQYAARSFVPLYIIYGPIYFIMFNVFHLQNPYIILSIMRIESYIMYIVVFKLTYKILCKSKRIDAVEFLVSTSYVTSSIQSHTFSNSIETLILLGVLSLYQILIKSKRSRCYKVDILIGILIVTGIFNRMTFPAFILFPSLRLFFRYYVHCWKSLLILIATIIITSSLYIQLDTLLFHSDTYVIASWNNLMYNINVSNLQLHGLHPRYTHLLVNIPQLIGPTLFLIIPTMKYQRIRDHLQRLPSLSVISTLTILSIFPHQELRFLVPLVPLIFITFHNIHSKIWIRIWLLFNIVMSLLMGCFHQGGIIRVICHYQNVLKQHEAGLSELGVHIWWKTYMPPTWMYMNSNLTVSSTKFTYSNEMIDAADLQIVNNHIIDLKGANISLLKSTLNTLLNQIDELILTVPTSMKTELFTLSSQYQIIEDYHTYIHLDLDHFDGDDLNSFIPGISSYKISKFSFK